MTYPEPLPQPLLPLASPQVTLQSAGGKGLNLARLVQAGFNVPPGFLIPTTVYQEFIDQHQLAAVITAALQDLDYQSASELQAASEQIRSAFSSQALPAKLAGALQIAHLSMGSPPLAVRSSATAEDLPDLSFAGQQDTFLNVIGVEALHRAVIQCWSSLWTARAIGYRAHNQIDQLQVSICVVVQKMVAAQASGVLFSANPLTGQRHETVIDATLGLGEALVSGQVEPDHYTVDTRRMQIIQKSLGQKALQLLPAAGGGLQRVAQQAGELQAIPDAVILELAQQGQQIAAHYHFPQDIEWAWSNGQLHILQSRPITSLFPLPENLESEPLKTLIGLHVIQGMLDPFTPLGQDFLKLILVSGARLFGIQPDLENQTGVLSAAQRLWINMTPIVLHPLGHKHYPAVIQRIDPGVAQAFEQILKDPRLAPRRGSFSGTKRWHTLRFALPVAAQIGRNLLHPDRERARLLAAFNRQVAQAQEQAQASPDVWQALGQRLELIERAGRIFHDLVIPKGIPAVVAGMMMFFGVLQRFALQASQELEEAELAQLHLEIARGLPHNVTTEMDLALWRAAQVIRAESAAREQFASLSAEELARRYQSGSLPQQAQAVLQAFMQQYGMRGIAEIDLGRPRWREQPIQVLKTLQSYLRIEDPELAPDAVFQRGARAAQAAVDRLSAAVRQTRGGWLKARLVRWGAGRYRALAGLREAPKFFAIRMMGVVRQALLDSGQAMRAARQIEQVDDLFFLTIAELRQIQQQAQVPAELRAAIHQRRATREREMRRAQLPRVLLSDGTAFYEGIRPAAGQEDQLLGDPVSPGVAAGRVRVVFDPYETHLEPGEILVCPGTDPAWTPLFLTAGGLVMEVGGMMTHGSVVAREYGIPAVVGVHQATSRLQTGQHIRLDGSSGQIEIIPEPSAEG